MAGMITGPDYFTVATVWQNAQALEGQRIRVRGWADIEISMTLLGCDPPSCGCNESDGIPFLFGTTAKPSHDRPSRVEEQRIYIADAECRGDECFLSCPLFHPTASPALELVGTLQVKMQHSRVGQLWLTDIDFEESSRLYGFKWLWLMVSDTLRNLPSEVQLK
jgi:hypothetical protein